jgi:N-terminal half of MaoC dehydratase
VAVERFPIEAGHIMMFARAIADPNPIYSDAEYAAGTEVGGVIAPPTFVFAGAQYDPDWTLRPKFDEPWMGSGREATQLDRSGGGDRSSSGRGLHAEQHFEYHRPLLAGDVLTSTVHPGATWEKEGRRGGTLQFSEVITEYRTLDGELVVTARMVGVQTGRAVEQKG